MKPTVKAATKYEIDCIKIPAFSELQNRSSIRNGHTDFHSPIFLPAIMDSVDPLGQQCMDINFAGVQVSLG